MAMLLNEQIKANLGDKKIVGVRQGDKFILGRHNLVPNGQGRYTNGTVEVRRNLATRPRTVSGWSVNPGTGGAAGLTYGTDASDLPGGNYARATWTQSATDSGGDRGLETLLISTIPVGAVVISMFVRPSVSQKMWIQKDGTSVTSFLLQPIFDCPAGEWTRIHAVLNVTQDGTAGLRAYAHSSGHAWQAGETLDSGAVLVEAAPVLRDYFDGSYSPDPDLTPSWTGTANESASVLLGAVPIRFAKRDKCQAVKSISVFPGATGICVIPTTNNNDSSVAPDSDIGNIVMGLIPGKTVAARARVYIPKPQIGPLSIFARGIAIFYKLSNTYYNKQSESVPNVEGEYVVECVFALPSTATEAFVRLYNGASVGGGDVYWTDIRVCQADTEEEALRMVRAPYRDGDSPGWTWDGTPGSSSSRGLS